MQSLCIYAGASARKILERDGWTPEIFSTLVGASGGAKFLGLGHLDNYLFGEYLQRSQHPMHLIGSSIGTWRHAALTRSEPVTALKALQQAYIHQYYDENEKITPETVSKVSLAILDEYMGATGALELCQHSRFSTHIVTARGRGPTASSHAVMQGTGLALAALSNSLNRNAMQAWFQRVVFSSSGAGKHGFPFSNFASENIQITADNTIQALHASGSIPFVLTGERNIPGAPAGQYWDGGIIDYHFDFANFDPEGLALYPHFRKDITPGWFDKFLPWRRARAEMLDKVVLLCPSEEYCRELPGGKIPDRRDFPKMTHDERVKNWQTALDASSALAEDFDKLVNGSNPLAGVRAF
jgi:hypothetical protein